jgi:hypothetical protein
MPMFCNGKDWHIQTINRRADKEAFPPPEAQKPAQRPIVS